MDEAVGFLQNHWADSAAEVVSACRDQKPFADSFTRFLDHCTACGGNWGGMILTGIKALYPEVWNAIPEKMGSQAFACLCYVLQLLDVDCSR